MARSPVPSGVVADRPFWKAGLVAGVLAAVATTAIAAIADASGISLDVDGEPIPLPAFATLTLGAVGIGVLLAFLSLRFTSRPRRTFVVTTVVLTAASLFPDVVTPMDGDTRAILMLCHLVAAAIVIPALASRLPEQR